MMKRRILYAIENRSFGGGEKSFAELINGIGGDFDIYVVCGSGEPFCGLIKDAAKVISFNFSKYNVLNVFTLASLIKEHSIDIVHSQGTRVDFYAALASRLAGAHHISTVAMPVEGFDVCPLKKSVYGFFSRLGGRMTSRTIVVSGTLKEFMTDRHGISPEKTVVIPNGVDAGVFEKAEPDGGLALKYRLSGKRVIGCAARLVWQKGLEHLIEAMAILREKDKVVFEGIICVIAGDGERETALKDLISAKGLEGRVVLSGFTHDVPAFLKTLDIFVMPSLREGQPIALLEAMAAGKPVIASAIDGIAETAADGIDALLVPPADPGALADALLKLSRDGNLAEELSRNARKKVSGTYSMESFISKHIEVYGKSLGF